MNKFFKNGQFSFSSLSKRLMDSIKLPFTFNAQALSAEVKKIPEEHFYDIYNPYLEPDTLYGFHLIEALIGSDPTEFQPNRILKVSPQLSAIYEAIRSEKETYRIHVLKAGARIRRHRDIGRNYQNGIVRIHIPVKYPSGIKTILNDNIVHWNEGECWYMDLDLPHEIINDSDEDRVHLVMDCKRNSWWEKIFDETGLSIEQSPYQGMSLEELTDMRSMLEAMDSEASRKMIDDLDKEIDIRSNE